MSDDTPRRSRRSTRLAGWNYAAPAYYFVTCCTHNRQPLFAAPLPREIATVLLQAIPTHPYGRNIVIDTFVVMPDHIHAIIVIVPDDQTPIDNELTTPRTFHHAAPGTLPVIVARYKASVTMRLRNLGQPRTAAVWQRGFYERIIRNDRELDNTRKYIVENPVRHAERRDNLDRLLERMDYQA